MTIHVNTQPALWVAHEHPERPLARGAWLCACPACVLAATAAAIVTPELHVVLKSDLDRRVVTITEAAVAMANGGIAALLDESDWIREVFVQ